MPSSAKDVLEELNQIGVMGGKVLPLPFVSPKQLENQHTDAGELREKLEKLGTAFHKILEKLDSLEGDVIGLKLAFQEATEVWSGKSVEESPEECDDEDETDEADGDGEVGDDGQETSNSD